MNLIANAQQPIDFHHEQDCRRHALKRAAERGMDINDLDLSHLENVARRMAPAFYTPKQRRYKLVYHFRNRRITAVFDAMLDCMVSVWPTPKGSFGETCRGDF